MKSRQGKRRDSRRNRKKKKGLRVHRPELSHKLTAMLMSVEEDIIRQHQAGLSEKAISGWVLEHKGLPFSSQVIKEYVRLLNRRGLIEKERK